MSKPFTDSAVMSDLVGTVNELDRMMADFRVKYHDVPSVVSSSDDKEMLAALYALCMDFFHGHFRPGTKQERLDNYAMCANDHNLLKIAVMRVASAT